MTTVDLAVGCHVRCILWEQEAIFNKGIGFLCGLKLFTLIYFVNNIYNQVYVAVANILKNSVKDVPINNYELLYIQACSFHEVWNKGCT